MLDLALAGELTVVYDDRVMAEWREVLSREKFGFAPVNVEALLAFLESEGLKIIPPVLAVGLPDPDDVPFLEAAVASGATLITGNLKHYPPEAKEKADILAPGEFLRRWATGLS